MKKVYKSPSTTAVEIETAPMMNAVSTETGSTNMGNTPVGGNTPDLSGENRGKWGDLW